MQTQTQLTNSSMTEIFGEVISEYSQQQAIEDGQLIQTEEISKLARQCGIAYPVLLTNGLFAAHVDCSDSRKSGDTIGRCWDLFSMFRVALRMQGNDGSAIKFRVKFGSRLVVVLAVCGPQDNGEPCITFMLPEDY